MFNPYGIGTPYGGFQMPQNTPLQVQNNQVNAYAYVNGLEGAKAFIVPPNSKMILMDSDNPIFYLKTANEAGQANIRAFKFEEIQAMPSSFSVPTVNYAKVEELNALNARIAKIEEALKNAEGTGNSSTTETIINS